MTCSYILNSIGLIFDIVGVILIFIFGISPSIDRSGSVSLSLGTDEKEKQKANVYDRYSRAGLILVVVGFTLQLIGNFLNK